MINDKLINPDSIVIVGGSDDLFKPGGKVLKNIIEGKYSGHLYVVNPKLEVVQGIKSYKDIHEIPKTDLAILVISARMCLDAVEILVKNKDTKAFIIISAGFSETGEEGRILEKKIVDLINESGGCLIGPNCIGVITQSYQGVFTSPVPKLNKKGCDLVSGSGATAVFIFESAMPKGLNFASVYSVGNSAQNGVEEVLEYWDNTYEVNISSPIKLIYVETVIRINCFITPHRLYEKGAGLLQSKPVLLKPDREQLLLIQGQWLLQTQPLKLYSGRQVLSGVPEEKS